MALNDEIFQQLFSSPTRGGYSDLDQFRQTVAGNDLYKMAASPILGAKFDTTTWSPATTFGVTAGQSFLGGLLNQLGIRDESRQLAKVADILPQLYESPATVAMPEGVDSEAFQGLRLNAARANMLEAASEKKQKDSMTRQIVSSLFSPNPALAMRYLQTNAPELMQDMGLDTESVASAFKTDQTQTEPDRLTDYGPNLGVPALEDEYKRLYSEAIQRGEKPQQASVYARETIDALRQRSKSLFGEDLQALSQQIGKIEELVQKGEEGMAKAGQTGSSLASAYEKAVSTFVPWSTPEADRQAAGDKMLEITRNMGASANRLVGSGALSNFESKALFATALSPENTPEQNAAILRNYRAGLEYAKQYKSFMDYFADKTGGNPTTARTMWDLYKQQNPIIAQNENGEVVINDAREPWQTFDFPSAYKAYLRGEVSPDVNVAPQFGSNMPSVGSMFNGEKIARVTRIK